MIGCSAFAALFLSVYIFGVLGKSVLQDDTVLSWVSEPGWHSVVLSDENVQKSNCVKGKCTLCVSKMGKTVCGVATAGSGSIHVQLVFENHVLVEGDITGLNPSPFCVKTVPGYSMIKDLCLIPKNVVLTSLSACLDVSAKVSGTTRSGSLGCFKIPKANVNTGDLLSELFSAYDTSDTLSTLKEESSLTKCDKGKCEFCKEHRGEKGCIIATVGKDSIHLKMTVNGQTIVEGDISGSNPSPVCTHKVPGQPKIQKLCMVPKDVDMSKLHACIDISYTVQGIKRSVPFKCFTIPASSPDILAELSQMFGEANCSKGKCEHCMMSRGQKGCVIATAGKDSIHLQLTLNGQNILEADISGASPPPICTKNIHGYPMIHLLCMIPKNVNISKLHACVDIFIMVQASTQVVALGCFTIPPAGTTDILTNLVQMLDGADCSKGKCEICKQTEAGKGCVVASAGKDLMHLQLTVKGQVLLEGDIKDSSPSPICTNRVPEIPVIQQLCMIPKDVQLSERYACIDISVLVQGMKRTESAGCFTIPAATGDLEKLLI